MKQFSAWVIGGVIALLFSLEAWAADPPPTPAPPSTDTASPAEETVVTNNEDFRAALEALKAKPVGAKTVLVLRSPDGKESRITVENGLNGPIVTEAPRDVSPPCGGGRCGASDSPVAPAVGSSPEGTRSRVPDGQAGGGNPTDPNGGAGGAGNGAGGAGSGAGKQGAGGGGGGGGAGSGAGKQGGGAGGGGGGGSGGGGSKGNQNSPQPLQANAFGNPPDFSKGNQQLQQMVDASTKPDPAIQKFLDELTASSSSQQKKEGSLFQSSVDLNSIYQLISQLNASLLRSTPAPLAEPTSQTQTRRNVSFARNRSPFRGSPSISRALGRSLASGVSRQAIENKLQNSLFAERPLFENESAGFEKRIKSSVSQKQKIISGHPSRQE